jgi:hypothetical protein
MQGLEDKVAEMPQAEGYTSWLRSVTPKTYEPKDERREAEAYTQEIRQQLRGHPEKQGYLDVLAKRLRHYTETVPSRAQNAAFMVGPVLAVLLWKLGVLERWDEPTLGAGLVCLFLGTPLLMLGAWIWSLVAYDKILGQDAQRSAMLVIRSYCRRHIEENIGSARKVAAADARTSEAERGAQSLLHFALLSRLYRDLYRALPVDFAAFRKFDINEHLEQSWKSLRGDYLSAGLVFGVAMVVLAMMTQEAPDSQATLLYAAAWPTLFASLAAGLLVRTVLLFVFAMRTKQTLDRFASLFEDTLDEKAGSFLAIPAGPGRRNWAEHSEDDELKSYAVWLEDTFDKQSAYRQSRMMQRAEPGERGRPQA